MKSLHFCNSKTSFDFFRIVIIFSNHCSKINKIIHVSISCPLTSMLSCSFRKGTLMVSTTLVLLVLRYRPAWLLASWTLFTISYNSSILSPTNTLSSAYLKFVILRPPIFTVPSKLSRAFLIITSEYMLNKCGDKIHPCRTPC